MTERNTAKRDYKPVLAKKDGRYHLFVPELGLTVSGNTLAEADEYLEQAIGEVVAKAQAAGLADQLPPPREDRAPRRVLNGGMETPAVGGDQGHAARATVGFSGFLLRLGVVFLAVLVLMGVGLWGGTSVARKAYAAFEADLEGLKDQISVDSNAVWAEIEEEILEAGKKEHDLPPEKEKELVESLTHIAERARPFFDAMSAAIPKGSEQCAATESGSSASDSGETPK